MRSLILCLLLVIGVSAEPITVKPADAKAQGFSFSASGDWIPVPASSMWHKHDVKYAPHYPESITAMADHDYSAPHVVEGIAMSQRAASKKEFEEVKLGPLRAMLKRGKSSFWIYSAHGETKITIGYQDGRDSKYHTSYEPLIQEILSSFKLSP